jgi:hypothetical protein
MKRYVKHFVALVASGLGGFYVGGQYAGRMAAATYRLSKPDWMVEVQQTLLVALIACGMAATAWIIMDYRE